MSEEYIILWLFIVYIFIGNGILYMIRKETTLIDNGFQRSISVLLFPIILIMWCICALFDNEY